MAFKLDTGTIGFPRTSVNVVKVRLRKVSFLDITRRERALTLFKLELVNFNYSTVLFRDVYTDGTTCV